MSRLKKHFLSIASRLDDNIDAVMLMLQKSLGNDTPLQIVPYRSYGTVNEIYVKGRVLKDRGIGEATKSDTLWNNLLSMYKRFDSDEVPGAIVQITFQNKLHEVTTDAEGYFTLELKSDPSISIGTPWHFVDIGLTHAPFTFSADIKAVASVLIPPTDAEYGIISDIDDTVIRTGATDLLAMSRNTLFPNAHSRMPFGGVTEFYNALH
jgi:phosphatidate phosphatase APP1